MFEHVCDPNAFPGDICQILKDDGIFVVAVPNVKSLGAIIQGNELEPVYSSGAFELFLDQYLDKDSGEKRIQGA